MFFNNPAARLHQILAACKKLEKETAGLSMLNGWRKALRVADGTSDFSVMQSIGKVYAIPSEIADRIRCFNDLDSKLYLGWRDELEDAFLNLSFSSEFKSFTVRVPKTLLINLEFCANVISTRSPEPMVDADQLAEFTKGAADILETLPTSELDAAGKQYFFDYLSLMRCAAEEYMITGGAGLQRAVDACTGTLVTLRRVSLPNREAPVGKQFWGLVNRISKILAGSDSESDTAHWQTGFKAMVRAPAA